MVIPTASIAWLNRVVEILLKRAHEHESGDIWYVLWQEILNPPNLPT